jgi:hypothetical protein
MLYGALAKTLQVVKLKFLPLPSAKLRSTQGLKYWWNGKPFTCETVKQ